MSLLTMNGRSAHALRVIRAQEQADELVRCLKAGELDADDLAIVVAPLYGEQLRAVCRAIVKALGRMS